MFSFNKIIFLFHFVVSRIAHISLNLTINTENTRIYSVHASHTPSLNNNLTHYECKEHDLFLVSLEGLVYLVFVYLSARCTKGKENTFAQDKFVLCIRAQVAL